MIRAGYTGFTPGRYLASLKWDGVTPNKDGLFEIPRNINTRIVEHLEMLCAKDDRFDWRFLEDAEPTE